MALPYPASHPWRNLHSNLDGLRIFELASTHDSTLDSAGLFGCRGYDFIGRESTIHGGNLYQYLEYRIHL